MSTTMDPATTRAMALLAAGVPLTLLIDLAGTGPTSREVAAAEGGDTRWIAGLRRPRHGSAA